MIADDASPWDEYDTRLLDDDDISLARAEARAELLAAEEYVMLDGLQLPYYSDLSALRSLDRELLRVQRMHLDPLRGVRGSLARAEARAELRAAEEYVMLDGLQLPYYSDLPALRALDRELLREHAMKLYSKLGHAKIGMSVPTAYDELVDWVWRVQGMHLDPLRGVGGSLARAELRAAEEYVMLDGLQLPFYRDAVALRSLDRELLQLPFYRDAV